MRCWKIFEVGKPTLLQMDFSGYHQVRIAEEDQAKITFATEWGSFAYTVIPFVLKNASTVFSRIVVTAFKEFIHKFLEI
jgi:hypothetical protein